MKAARLAALLLAIAAGALPADTPHLSVTGDVATKLTLSRDDLAKMPRATTVFEDHGKSTRYEGVTLHEILKRAGVPEGEALKGKLIGSYVLAIAEDGYQAVFSITETDPSFSGAGIVIADASDGNPLAEKIGPFRVVAPQHKKGARCVRMLRELRVVRVNRQ